MSTGYLAEIGTLQLEFRYLSRKTNKKMYEEKSMKVFKKLYEQLPSNGLYKTDISFKK